MNTEDIKKILLPRINPELLRQAQNEGIPDAAIFNQRLFLLMTQLTPNLVIQFPWQLSAFGSGLVNYQLPIDWGQTDNRGVFPVHYVACSGNPVILAWVLTHDKDALTRKTNDGLTAVHYAAWSGNPAILAWVLTHDKDALTRRTYDGLTAVYFAAWSGNPAILQHLLHEYPQLTKKAWIRNQDGDFPNAFAPVSMTPKPYQILDEALLEATNRVIDHVAKPNDLILLASFQDEWRALLINKEGVRSEERRVGK